MGIPVNIAPSILANIASLYNNTNKIILEYIDNSIDSAEVLFDSKTNSYTSPIKITVVIDKNKKLVYIEDNCAGIPKIEDVVNSIGDSNKKNQTWSNGQFGFGIFSCFSSNKTFKIISKVKSQKLAKSIIIKRKDFDKKTSQEVQLPDLKEASFQYESGTRIELLEFEKDKWKDINLDSI